MQTQVTVEPPLVSDHSVITATIKLDDVVWSVAPTTVRSSWRLFDIDAFKNDLLSTVLFVKPPGNCENFFALYDSMLKSLLDKHAPLKPTATGRRQSALWFNAECRQIKAKTRRLEEIFCSTRCDDAQHRWREQFTLQRSTFQKLYATAARRSTTARTRKTLWRRLNALL